MGINDIYRPCLPYSLIAIKMDIAMCTVYINSIPNIFVLPPRQC